jgi:hypothetical protein
MTVTDEDKELALKIANQMERVYVAKGHTRANIAEAVAKGIALGRQQGLELAASKFERELTVVVASIRAGQTSN